ncbi:WD40 repeat domain-containing protein [Pyxidicoccus sp. 3LFB2]
MSVLAIGNIEKVRALAANARMLLVGGARASAASRVTAYEPGSNKVLWSTELPSAVLALSISGERWAAAGADGTLHFGTLSDGKVPFQLHGAHPGGVTALASSADGQRLFSAGADGTVRLRPPRPGTLQVTHGVWPGLSRTVHVLGPDGPVYPLEAPLVPTAVSQSVKLAPEVAVNVRLKVEGTRVTYWVEDARGQVLEGRRVHVALSGGERVEEVVEGGRTSFTVRAPGPVGVSVADVSTGVTALAEVRP